MVVMIDRIRYGFCDLVPSGISSLRDIHWLRQKVGPCASMANPIMSCYYDTGSSKMRPQVRTQEQPGM